MLNVLQSLFIIILRPVSRVSSKLSDNVRNICIQLTCMYFPLYFVYYYMGLKNRELFHHYLGTHNAVHLLGCVFLLILIIFSLDREPMKVRWSAWIMYPMIICGIWMMVISFIHPVGDGYRAFAMMLIIAYPCLFFVWNNRGDYEKLFNPLSRAVALTGVLYFVFCFYLASKGELLIVEGRCAGLLHDANLFSMIGMVASCGSMYLLVKDRESWLRFFLYSIALGIGIAVVLMGQSRISLAVCIVNVLVAMFFYLRYSDKSKVPVVVVKIICILGIVVSMIFLSYVCIAVQQNTVIQISNSTEAGQETPTEPNVIQPDNTSVIDRMEYDENATLDTYTAGRYHIWKGYMQFMNLTGNDYSKVDWSVLTQYTARHAHNNFFEMAYRFGVPLGVLFIILEVIVCLKALQYLFINRQKQIVLLWSLLFVVMFFFESMFDIATLPFERDAPFYFYMAIIPMVDMDYKFKDEA